MGMNYKMTQYPMYEPSMEHESCGVGAVVDLDGGESHQIVSDALTMIVSAVVIFMSYRQLSDAPAGA